MEFSKLEIDLAYEFGITPLQVRGFIDVFRFIDRFSFVKSKDELSQLCMEIAGVKNKKRHYTYTNIPEMLKNTITMFLDKGKSVGSFYCTLRLEKNIKTFIKECLIKKIQPKEFYAEGIITYKELMKEPKTDMTSEEHTYIAN